MKKFISITTIALIAVLVAALLLVGSTFTTKALTEGDYEYTVTNGEATITGYTGDAGYWDDSLGEIPSTLGGYPVTAIGSYVFSGADVSELVIPDGVKTIGEGAFKDCSPLTIVLPKSVTYIGAEAFYYYEEVYSGCEYCSCYSCSECTCIDCGCPECSGGGVILPDEGCEYCPCYSCSECSCFDCSCPECSGGLVTNPEGDVDVPDLDDWSLRSYSLSVNIDVWYEGNSLSNIDIGSNNNVLDNATWHYDSCMVAEDYTHSYSGVCDVICDSCGKTTREATGGHYVASGDFEAIEITNDATYPFELSDNKYTSTNKTNSSTSSLNIVALDNCLLNITYGVSSESNWDWLKIYKNSTLLDQISGNVTDKVISIELVAGDQVSIKYTKDSSSSSGNDEGYFVISSVGVPANSLEATCTSAIICSYCGTEVKPVLPHAYDNAFDFECNICHDVREIDYSKYFEYTIENKQITITKYIGSETVVEIPSTIDGYPVTIIGYRTFWNCSSLTSVTIPDGVTTIGDAAFASCSSLTSVKIPNSVTFIGNSAFLSCISLTNVEIPNSVTIIDDNAFANCSSLASVIIPDSVTTIGGSAFADCDNLECVVIGDGVTSIGTYAFLECSNLASVTIGNSVTFIGFLAFSDCNNLKSVHITDIAAWCKIEFEDMFSQPLTYADEMYLNGELLTELVVPDGITTILENAFYSCETLTSVILPDSVININRYGFYDCTNIEHLSLGENVTNIGFQAFASSVNLTELLIPSSVTSIEDFAFVGCTELLSVVVEEGNAKYHSMNNCIIETASKRLIIGCRNSKIPSDGSVVEIGDYSFFGCTDLLSISVPKSIIKIGEASFDRCSNITNVWYEGDLQADILIEDRNDIITSAIWHYNACMANDEAYEHVYDNACDAECNNCGTIREGADHTYEWVIDVEPTATETGLKHEECTLCGETRNEDTVIESLCEFTYEIVDGEVTITGYIGNGGDVVIPSALEGYPVTTIRDYAFEKNSSITSVVIPDTVIIIGRGAIRHCSILTSVVIGDSVTMIDEFAFLNCRSLANIEVSSNNANYTSHDGVLFTKDGTILVQYPIGKGLTKYIISDSVTTIGLGAFRHCKVLTDVVIGNGVTTIDHSAFYDCSVTRVWYEGDSQSNINISTMNETLTSATWHYNSCMKSDNYIHTYSSVCDGDCNYCGKTREASHTYCAECDEVCNVCGGTRETEVEHVYDNACDAVCNNCDNIRVDIHVYDNEFDVECNECHAIAYKKIFEYNNDNGEITITKYIGTEIEVVIPAEIDGCPVTQIGDMAFMNCELVDVVIPDSVKHIGAMAFYGCIYMENVKIGEGVTTIGDQAFYGCITLIDVEIGDNVTIIGDQSFSGCVTLVNVKIGKNVKIIGSEAFRGCIALVNITIPDNVTIISDGAFKDCEGLLIVTMGSSVSTIGDNAFYGCGSLATITIPASVGKIGNGAFANCGSLNDVRYESSSKDGIDIGDDNDSLTSSNENYDSCMKNPTSSSHAYDNSCDSDCNYCGKIRAVSHNYGWVVDVEPTCGTAGSQHRVCRICNIVISENIAIAPTNNHTYGDWVRMKEPTCTTVGREMRTCTVCSSTTETREVAVIDHTYEWVVDQPAGLGRTGLKHEDCTVCHAIRNENTIIEALQKVTTEAGFICELNEDGASVTITGYSGSETDIVIPDTVEGFPVTAIGDSAFYSKYRLTSVIIGNNVTKIGSHSFWQCVRLTCVTIPDNVIEIDSYAFDECTSLSSVTIGVGVTRISSKVFIRCDNLITLTVEEGNTKYHSAGNCIIETETKKLVVGCNGSVIPSDGSVTNIAPSAFYYCTTLTSVVVPDGVTTIGYDAFGMCNSLMDITFPGSVSTIGQTAFRGCKNLKDVWYEFESQTNITLYDGNDSLTLATWHYNSCMANNETHEHTYNNDCDVDCNNCGKIRVITHDYKWVIDLESTCGAAGSKHEECTVCGAVQNENTVIEATDNHTYGDWIQTTAPTCTTVGEDTRTCTVCGGTETREVSVIDHTYEWVIDIEPTATTTGLKHEECTVCGATRNENTVIEALTVEFTYTIKNGAATITGYTGSDVNIIIPSTIDGYPVTAIGISAFRDYINLLSVVISDGVKTIGNNAFSDCSGLKSAVIPDSVTTMGTSVFRNCSNLSNVTIGNSVTSIGDSAFYKCTSLTSVKFGDSVVSIGFSVFSNCTNLTTVIMGNSFVSVGNSAFYKCTSLTDVWYEGESQTAISIENGNSYLTSATWHYNCCMVSKDYVHTYTNACDTDCDYCEKTTRVAPHNCEWVIDVEPTCSATGVKHEVCTICGVVRNENTIVEATGIHLFDSEDDEKCNTCDYIRYIAGDVDGDEGITDADAIYLLLHTYFPEDYPISQPCDFDGNGKVDDQDAVHLLFYTFFPEFYPIPEAPKYEIIALPKDDGNYEIELPLEDEL